MLTISIILLIVVTVICYGYVGLNTAITSNDNLKIFEIAGYTSSMCLFSALYAFIAKLCKRRWQLYSLAVILSIISTVQIILVNNIFHYYQFFQFEGRPSYECFLKKDIQYNVRFGALRYPMVFVVQFAGAILIGNVDWSKMRSRLDYFQEMLYVKLFKCLGINEYIHDGFLPSLLDQLSSYRIDGEDAFDVFCQYCESVEVSNEFKTDLLYCIEKYNVAIAYYYLFSRCESLLSLEEYISLRNEFSRLYGDNFEFIRELDSYFGILFSG